ncbi:hypothetical protein M153_892000881 [Pseudoloma neurophilia]|uniref:Kinetochore protein SPC25 n=1 Tax=Pseudoloma neurophilia TaxID=146866 RepID=A0A0R0M3L4_9MICR|nr:hypothetical protein M153_892000881 [Pseudoloma neurophilia]
MDKDSKIDSLILQMRDINKMNSTLIESLKSEMNKNIQHRLEWDTLTEENDKLKIEIKRLQNEIISKKKEINRTKKNFNVHIKRLEAQNGVVSENPFYDLNRKNLILENLLYYIGKKFHFDGELLLDVYNLVEDPNDDFLRRLVENMSESHWKSQTDEKENKQ